MGSPGDTGQAMRRLIFLCLLLGLALGTVTDAYAANHPARARASVVSACPQPDAEAPAAEQVTAMLCLTNAVRAQYGEEPLELNTQLAESATDKTADIFNCDSFSHTACGHSFSYWVWETGYVTHSCWRIGENLAWGAGTYGATNSIFRAWMRSPTHRANILGDYTQMGISTAVGALEGEKSARVWTVHFGDLC
jgi:uncharacterized protein YkwD